jgi:hypothetical protein
VWPAKLSALIVHVFAFIKMIYSVVSFLYLLAFKRQDI